MDGEELRGLYSTGWRDFSGLDFREANISGINLSSDDPDYRIAANLNGIDLSGANLTEACLSAAKLVNTNMRGANLLYTDMTQCGVLMGEWLPDAKNIGKVNFGGTTVYDLTLEDGTFIEFSDRDW